jgi:hypothetical protein
MIVVFPISYALIWNGKLCFQFVLRFNQTDYKTNVLTCNILPCFVSIDLNKNKYYEITFIASLLFLKSLASFGYTLLIRTFGNIKDKPLIFFRNGLGYNCANFEGPTAKKLAKTVFTQLCI